MRPVDRTEEKVPTGAGGSVGTLADRRGLFHASPLVDDTLVPRRLRTTRQAFCVEVKGAVGRARSISDCEDDLAWLRKRAGGRPNSRLNARLKDGSDS